MKCVPALDLGYLGPVSLQCFNAKYSQNRCMTWISVDFDTRVRLRLMWNVDLKTLGYFGVSAHDLEYLGWVSPNVPNT